MARGHAGHATYGAERDLPMQRLGPLSLWASLAGYLRSLLSAIVPDEGGAMDPDG